jgi:hypothetical protein
MGMVACGEVVAAVAVGSTPISKLSKLVTMLILSNVRSDVTMLASSFQHVDWSVISESNRRQEQRVYCALEH